MGINLVDKNRKTKKANQTKKSTTSPRYRPPTPYKVNKKSSNQETDPFLILFYIVFSIIFIVAGILFIGLMGYIAWGALEVLFS